MKSLGFIFDNSIILDRLNKQFCIFFGSTIKVICLKTTKNYNIKLLKIKWKFLIIYEVPWNDIPELHIHYIIDY